MSAENETIADIAAFIRRCLDLLDTELSRKSNGKPAMSAEALLCPVLNARAALDRLDAAWKREQDPAPKSPYSTTYGNSAAMREALLSIRDLDFGHEEDLYAFYRIIESALAAPARNCDFYDNKTDAETRFVEETGENDMAQHYWQMFAIWLLSPAAEQKGETNGSK